MVLLVSSCCFVVFVIPILCFIEVNGTDVVLIFVPCILVIVYCLTLSQAGHISGYRCIAINVIPQICKYLHIGF
jgi:hypothetical protein